MSIRFRHGGTVYTAETAKEAAELRALLGKQHAEAAAKLWTAELFNRFINRLAEPQRAALSFLVTRRTVTDEEFRKELGLSSNQALAGTLSGISKQAAALNIPARAVFALENIRYSGKRKNRYTAAEKLVRICSKLGWPNT